ncbi:MAG: hypothetical protein QGH55_06635 [Acidimicrobiales bacterium]|nr:hypothetical protein [Acidimicrobiales bacterium]
MAEPTRPRRSRQAGRTRRARRTVRPRRMVVASAAILVLGGFLLAGCGSEPTATSGTPDLQLTSVDGERVALSDYLGRPVAVMFMHTY